MNDLISRQTAIEAIKEDKIDLTNPNVVAVFKATGDFEKVETQVMTCDRHIKMLKDLPSAQPERKHGYWIESHEHVYMCNEVKEWTNWYCSECDAPNSCPTDYCPNCGARMEADDESN